MTELVISVSWQGITAAEIYCGDDVKYLETFSTWWSLLETLDQFMDSYSLVRIVFISPFVWNKPLG